MKARYVTAEELYAMGADVHDELVRGALFAREPAGFYHGKVAGQFLYRIRQYLEQNPVGIVVTAETGFILCREPDTVRAPDCAVVLNRRLTGDPPREFFEGAPDIAVEVLSPSERWPEALEKVKEYLDAGTSIVWVADPENRSVREFVASQERILGEKGTLDGGMVLPGFLCPVADLFA